MTSGEIVRIGGASAFLGDSITAVPQLLASQNTDYIVMDYLAEVTMSYLGQQKREDATKGYADDFVTAVCRPNLMAASEQGVKLVTNAGGVNPLACKKALEDLIADMGLDLTVAAVVGDDVTELCHMLKEAHVTEMYSHAEFPSLESINSANVYLGAFEIAAALEAGADVVVTGRVVDSALTLGCLIHEFGWQRTDYDLLASGTLAGHIVECGAQATGGLFTDWEQVPGWDNIGYPVISCREDGSFIVSKPKDTGGVIAAAAVAEQMLYEVGDPQAYMVPDVVCDFSAVEISQRTPDSVQVSPAKGYPAPSSYKACITFHDGYRATSLTPVLGRDAAKKAQQQAEALIKRTERVLAGQNLGPFRATRIDIIGNEATYGANARTEGVREVIAKVAVEHENALAAKIYMREHMSPITSMSVGTTAWAGNEPKMMPIMRLFSCTVDRALVQPKAFVSGETLPGKTAEPPYLDHDAIDYVPPGELAEFEHDTKTLPLIELAWGRSGDKGDKFNIGVIARKAEYLPYIRRALTADALFQYFRHEFEDPAESQIEIFELPGINGLNLLFHDALGGGGVASMRVDMLAKGKAQQLMDFPVVVPSGMEP